eukprot:5104640-Lingulodinium_polyedra.AAC.1
MSSLARGKRAARSARTAWHRRSRPSPTGLQCHGSVCRCPTLLRTFACRARSQQRTSRRRCGAGCPGRRCSAARPTACWGELEDTSAALGDGGLRVGVGWASLGHRVDGRE